MPKKDDQEWVPKKDYSEYSSYGKGAYASYKPPWQQQQCGSSSRASSSRVAYQERACAGSPHNSAGRPAQHEQGRGLLTREEFKAAAPETRD